MTFSIVIPYYQGESYLEACLDSIYRNSSAPDLEIIVVDDGSPRPIPKKVKNKFATVSWRRNSKNLGFVRTCNRGAETASGDIIFFLNMDTEIMTPRWPEILGRAFAGDQKIGIVGVKLVFPGAGLVQSAGNEIHPDSLSPVHLYYLAPADLPAVNKARELSMVTGAAMAVTKKLFHELGGFSLDFQTCYEDSDFCLRARQKGFRVLYIPDVVVQHFETVTGVSHVKYFASYFPFYNKWRSFLKRPQPKFYEDDGFSQEFIRRMQKICRQDFNNIATAIEVMGLKSAKIQRQFIGAKDDVQIIEEIIAKLKQKNQAKLADFIYYEVQALLTGEDTRRIMSRAEKFLHHARQGSKRDEILIMKWLSGQLNEKNQILPSNPNNQAMFQILTDIINGRASADEQQEIYQQSLFVKLLRMIIHDFAVVSQQNLRLLGDFYLRISRTWFDDKELLIQFFIKLATRFLFPDGSTYFLEAKKLVEQREWPDFKKSTFLINLGSYLEKSGDYPGAIPFFRRILKKSSTLNPAVQASLFYHLGFCYFKKSRKKLAVHYLGKCLKLLPYHRKGLELMTLLQNTDYLDERNLIVIYRRASALQRKDQYARAKSLFNDILGSQSDNILHYHSGALFHLAQMEQNRKKKISLLNQCLKLNPSHREAWVLKSCLTARGRLHYEKKQNNPIRQFFEKYPLNVQIQTISSCNGRCRMCPYHDSWHKKHPGRMSAEVFDHVLAILKGIPLGKVCLYGNNEPLMDSNLFIWIEKIQKNLRFKNIEISTNGQLLSDRHIHALLDHLSDAPHQIWISWHGVTPAAYHEWMGFDFEKNLKKLKNYFAITRGRLTTVINSIYGNRLDSSEQFGSRDDVLHFFQRILAETIPDCDTANIFINPLQFHDRAGLVAAGQIDNPKIKGLLGKLKPDCCRIREWLHINNDGDILLCCMDYQKETVMGNVMDFSSLAGLLSGSSFMGIQKKALGKNKSEKNFICRRCTSPGG